MVMKEISDERVENLRVNLMTMLQLGSDGFANNLLWKSELASLLIEVKGGRDKPLHCPGCDGDHL